MRMKTFAIILLVILFSNKAYTQYEDGWKWVNPYPNGMNINYIQFFNLNNGYSLVGEFLKTTNSGLNWIHGTDTTNSYPFYFLNMNTGWRFTWNEIQKTTNEGENWYRTSYRNPYVRASKVIFIDSLYGMSSGTNINPLGSNADISWTTNGGLNWSNITFFDVNYMHTLDILNPTLAIALGSNYSNFFVLYKSTNFGQSWDTIRTTPPFGATKLKILD